MGWIWFRAPTASAHPPSVLDYRKSGFARLRADLPGCLPWNDARIRWTSTCLWSLVRARTKSGASPDEFGPFAGALGSAGRRSCQSMLGITDTTCDLSLTPGYQTALSSWHRSATIVLPPGEAGKSLACTSRCTMSSSVAKPIATRPSSPSAAVWSDVAARRRPTPGGSMMVPTTCRAGGLLGRGKVRINHAGARISSGVPPTGGVWIDTQRSRLSRS